METLTTIFIFFLCFVLYSQIVYQLKKGDTLEIYEIDYSTNRELNDCANLKQPFLFMFGEEDSKLGHLTPGYLSAEYGSFDVVMKESSDYFADNPSSSIPLTFNATRALMGTDTQSKYYSDNNQYFLNETGLKKYYKQFDKYLEPVFSVFSKYDILFGSSGAIVPLQYHTYERRYLYLTSGKITVKMTPWRSTKYMIINKDYLNYEFSSPLNVWVPQEQYKSNFQKMKFVEFTIQPGNILYIPPFWHYSLKMDSENTIIHGFNYSSVMNVVANSVNIGKHILKILNRVDINNKSNEYKDGTLSDDAPNNNETKDTKESKESKEPAIQLLEQLEVK